MTRTDFQRLADVRIAEAKALLDAGLFDGAYYLAGYAVECALKACIAKRTNLHDFPPTVEFVRGCYVHNIELLVKSAELMKDRDADSQNDRQLFQNWLSAAKWSESSRYASPGEHAAKELYNAITDPAHGVLPWIKAYW